jgi:putative nucleotidyltransferase with HDIG domain
MIDVAQNDAAIKDFIDQNAAVHALPDNAIKIIRMTNDANCSTAQLFKQISADAALTARIMKAVNSAYYSLPKKISSLDHAITFMGLRAVKEVTLSSTLASACKPVDLGKYDARDLWDHSLGVAVLARELAVQSGSADPEEAFTTGMLHDVGLLLTTQSAPQKCSHIFAAAEKPGRPFTDLEQHIFKFDHAELGGRLGENWQFPPYMSAAIRWHHQPDQAPIEHHAICLLMYIADTFCCEAKVGFPLTCQGQTVTDQHLETAKLKRDAVAKVSAKLRLLLRLYA